MLYLLTSDLYVFGIINNKTIKKLQYLCRPVGESASLGLS